VTALQQHITGHSSARAAIGRRENCHPRKGFSLLELVVVLGIVIVFVVISVPLVASASRNYRLNGAAAAIAGAIQKTRYQAIQDGCSYQIVFTAGTTTYQVQSQTLAGNPPTCAAAFTNVGGLVPWTSTNQITLPTSTTFQFNPNGVVTAPVGGMVFQLSNAVQTRTITVSGVGNATVTHP
jgi:Tfp pilus assembly protein FimT